jgi:predicted CXXCH cytochrome family protein
MKKLLFLGVGSVVMFTMGGIGSAQADAGPHSIVQGKWSASVQITSAVSTEGAGQCANCHRAHTAQGTSLLKQAQPALCLNCHDGNGSSLDVVDGKSMSGGALRAGGFTKAQIDSGAGATKTLTTTGSRLISQIAVLGGGAPVTSSHQINGTTTGTMWGNGTTGMGQTAVTLECGACHDPHGNGNYRILKANPDGSNYITSSPGVTPVTTSATTKINIPDQPAKVYTTVNYWDVQAPGVPATLNGVALPPVSVATATKPAVAVTDGFLGNIAAWCTTCHTRYLAVSGVANTNSGDTTFTYKHRSDEGASYKPNCIQCHVAHGTNAVMTGSAGSVTEPSLKDATTGLNTGVQSGSYQSSDLLRVDDRGTCLMCHAVGGPNPLSPVLP